MEENAQENAIKLGEREIIQLNCEQEKILNTKENPIRLTDRVLKVMCKMKAVDLLENGDFENFHKLEDQLGGYLGDKKKLFESAYDSLYPNHFLEKGEIEIINKINSEIGISKEDFQEQMTTNAIKDYKDGKFFSEEKGESCKRFFNSDFFKNEKIIKAFKSAVWEKLRQNPRLNKKNIVETIKLLDIDFQPEDIVRQIVKEDSQIIEEIKKFPKLYSEYMETFDNLSIVLEFVRSDKEFIEKSVRKHGKNIGISSVEKELFFHSIQERYNYSGYFYGWNGREDKTIKRYDNAAKTTDLLISELDLSNKEITILSPTSNNASFENKISKELNNRSINNVKIFCGDISNVKPCRKNMLPYLKLNALELPFHKSDNKDFNGFNIVLDRKGLLRHLIFKLINIKGANHHLLKETLDGYFKILKNRGFVLIDAIEEKYSQYELDFNKEKSSCKYVSKRRSADDAFLTREVSTKSLIDGYLKICDSEFRELFNEDYKITYIGEEPHLLAKIEKNNS